MERRRGRWAIATVGALLAALLVQGLAFAAGPVRFANGEPDNDTQLSELTPAEAAFVQKKLAMAAATATTGTPTTRSGDKLAPMYACEFDPCEGDPTWPPPGGPSPAKTLGTKARQQNNYYYCGPASGQVVINWTRGIVNGNNDGEDATTNWRRQSKIAQWMSTTSAGTASRPGADEGSRSDASGAAPDTAEPPTRDDQAARTPFGGSGSGSGHDLFEPSRGGGQQVPAQQAGSAYPDDAEPPEESADPALGRVAATVEDEVLVIDEQPRYHLTGCRALMAQQTIPLPAREAVELGFTPCGWCNPVAALGARHPASAR